MKDRPFLTSILVIAALAGVVAVLHHLHGDADGGGEPQDVPLQDHPFQVEGARADWPYYPKVFFRTRPADAPGDTGWSGWDTAPFEEDGSFVIPAPRGHAYQLLSELTPPSSMQKLFWMIKMRGPFTDDGSVTPVPLPPRTHLRLQSGAAPPGDEIVTVFHEDEAIRGWFVNDPVKGVFEGFQRGKEIGVFQRRALSRPVVADTFKPGAYVVAAKAPGRQWIARRMDLQPNGTADLEVGRAPSGGGKVTCADGDALLLLGGELAVPVAWKDHRYRYTAEWAGVPPGKHAMLYPDGRRVEFDVEDGKTVELPR